MQPVAETVLQFEVVAILVGEQEVAPRDLGDARFAATQTRLVEFVDERIEPACVCFAYSIDIADVGQGMRQGQGPVQRHLQLRRAQAEVGRVETGRDQRVAVAATRHGVELRGHDGIDPHFRGIRALEMGRRHVDRTAPVRDLGQGIQRRHRERVRTQQCGGVLATTFRAQALGHTQRDLGIVLFLLQGFVQRACFGPLPRAPQQSRQVEACLAMLRMDLQGRAPVRFGVAVAEQFQGAVAASVQRGGQIAANRRIVRAQRVQPLQAVEQGVGVVEAHRGIDLDRQGLQMARICSQQGFGIAQRRLILPADKGGMGAGQQGSAHAQAVGASARPSLAPLSRPSSTLIHCPVATSAARSMPVSKPHPCNR